jgi:hypothetical protein
MHGHVNIKKVMYVLFSTLSAILFRHVQVDTQVRDWNRLVWKRAILHNWSDKIHKLYIIYNK